MKEWLSIIGNALGVMGVIIVPFLIAVSFKAKAHSSNLANELNGCSITCVTHKLEYCVEYRLYCSTMFSTHRNERITENIKQLSNMMWMFKRQQNKDILQESMKLLTECRP